MKQYITNSEKETKHLAVKLSKGFEKGVIALSGELGAGKTTFVQGFAKGLGIKEKVISPTYVLILQHKIPSTSTTLYHIDLYRLDSIKNLKELGIEELVNNPENLVLIEWAEKAKQFLPKNYTKINIEKSGDNSRTITLS